MPGGDDCDYGDWKDAIAQECGTIPDAVKGLYKWSRAKYVMQF